MKIPRDRNPRTREDRLRPPTVTRRNKSRGLKEHEVLPSPRNDEVREFTELAKSLPDVRQGKIDDIKGQILAGTYKVSAESVARSIAGLHAELSPDVE